jgi:hypothetical protein
MGNNPTLRLRRIIRQARSGATAKEEETLMAHRFSFGLVALIGAALCLAAPATDALAKSSQTRISARLENTGADLDASGKVEWRSQKDRVRFKVEAEDLDPASYDVVVAGIVEATLEVAMNSKGSEGEVEFRNPAQAGKQLLDFDPRGQLVTIERAGVVYLQVVLPNVSSGGGGGGSGGGGGGSSSKARIKVGFVSTGADSDASGKVDWRSEDGRVRFNVEAEDLDPASYDVKVGGAVKASLEVNAIGSVGSAGEVEFRNPVEPGKLLLDFDPRGQLVTIERAGTIYLQVLVPLE